MLPLHRDRDTPQGSWRNMAIVTGDSGAPAASQSKYRSLRWKLRSSRTMILLIGGTVLCLWWLGSSLLHEPPPFAAGFFHGPEQEPFRPPHHSPRPPLVDDANPSLKTDWRPRAERVKEAFLHAYHGYEAHALPMDELLPLTNGSVNNFNGWGVSAVDALDTMYIMGLHDEFQRGIALVENMTFTADNHTYAPFFETTIRYLGGLLSAYGLSRDASLLKRADELGMALLPVFNTSSGFPVYAVNPATGKQMTGWSGYHVAWLAEIASCQMEYKYLAKVTGRKEYYDVAETVNKRLYDANLSRYPYGLLPTAWNTSSGQPVNDQISIGSLSDSAYEYFLKQWILTGKTEKESLALYLRTMKGMLDHNMYLSPLRKLLYVTDTLYNSPSRRFEHLSCFFPGLLALGASSIPADVLSADERQLHMWAAHGLGVSCHAMYADQPSGLGADEIVFLSAYEMEWARAEKARIADAEREAEKLAKERPDMETPTPTEKGEGRGKGKGKGKGKFHGHPPNDKIDDDDDGVINGGLPPRPHKHYQIKVNQTEEDEKLRWTNVLAAWREGRYGPDGYIVEETTTTAAEAELRTGIETPPAGPAHERTRRAPITGQPLGPVPGLADSPPTPADSPLRDYRNQNSGYYLRPETIESFFILWRTTGDVVWRERGWQAFLAIERESRTASGYAVLKNVGYSNGQLGDSMPSYFLAETLKYLYLLFSDDSVIPLDKYVFNTEAHPFPIFEWTAWEKQKFGIS